MKYLNKYVFIVLVLFLIVGCTSNVNKEIKKANIAYSIDNQKLAEQLDDSIYLLEDKEVYYFHNHQLNVYHFYPSVLNIIEQNHFFTVTDLDNYSQKEFLSLAAKIDQSTFEDDRMRQAKYDKQVNKTEYLDALAKITYSKETIPYGIKGNSIYYQDFDFSKHQYIKKTLKLNKQAEGYQVTTNFTYNHLSTFKFTPLSYKSSSTKESIEAYLLKGNQVKYVVTNLNDSYYYYQLNKKYTLNKAQELTLKQIENEDKKVFNQDKLKAKALIRKLSKPSFFASTKTVQMYKLESTYQSELITRIENLPYIKKAKDTFINKDKSAYFYLVRQYDAPSYLNISAKTDSITKKTKQGYQGDKFQIVLNKNALA